MIVCLFIYLFIHVFIYLSYLILFYFSYNILTCSRNFKNEYTRSKEGRKEVFYLKTHSPHLVTVMWKEGNVLFNDSLNTFYLWLYGGMHMVKNHSDSERGNPLPHGLLCPISSMCSFICTIPQTG